MIPEMYGYKGVKWLTRMELVAQQPTGYWEKLGYDQNAWVGRSNGYSSSAEPRACRASARTERARPLGARDRVRVLLGVGALPLPAEPRRGGRPAPAAEGDPHLHRRRLGVALVARRRARRPAALRRDGPRGRALRRRRPRLAPRPPRAAGPAERGPEAEHGRRPPRSRCCSRSPASSSGTASATRASASRTRCSSTTG